MDIQVQTVKVDWSKMPKGIIWYFIGAPKTGKTTQASKWHEKGSEKVLLLDSDFGASFVNNANTIPIVCLPTPWRQKKNDKGELLFKKSNKGKKIPDMEIIPPEERGYFYRAGTNRGKPMAVYSFEEVFIWLIENWVQLPYDTLALDTIDKINEWVEERVCQKLEIDTIADAEWGAGWANAKQRVIGYIDTLIEILRLSNSDFIVTSHSKPTSTVDGKIQLAPDLPKGLANAILGKADVIGYTTASKADNKYYISFLSYDERSVGSRLEPLKQKKLPFSYEAVVKEVENFGKENNKEA